MSKSKWIEIESADEPVSRVAQRTIVGRLETVWHYLPRAARESDERVEHVHQLRVASRRAMAAIKIFDEYSPAGRTFWFRKRLKKVRRAAGAARDLDVLGMRLLRSCPSGVDEACEAILKKIRKSRQSAQRPINQIHAGLAEKGFKRKITSLGTKIRYRGKSDEPTIAVLARERMRDVLAAFFTAAANDLSDITALHQFRISGKELRYTMEIFSGVFPRSFRDELYPLVEELQEKLGEINDHASALARLHEWTESTTDTAHVEFLHQLLDVESDALAKSQTQFLAWWTGDWATELKRQFELVLDADRVETAS